MATGFEQKSFKVIIQNFLYHLDPEVRTSALVELMIRFKKTFPRPEWLPEEKKNG